MPLDPVEPRTEVADGIEAPHLIQAGEYMCAECLCIWPDAAAARFCCQHRDV